jgi:hypothetical protein
VTLRARWVTLRARWVTLRARWVTLRARWVTLSAGDGSLVGLARHSPSGGAPTHRGDTEDWEPDSDSDGGGTAVQKLRIVTLRFGTW